MAWNESKRLSAAAQLYDQMSSDMRMMEHMQEMDAMAKSMTSMADMCRMMMDKEMKRMPLRVAAGVIFGSLVTVALAPFVMLEIQWIRYWGVLLKREKDRQN